MLPARLGDTELILSEGLRSQDLAEITALHADHAAALQDSVVSSGLLAFTIHVDGKPAGLFGVCPGVTPEVGFIWMVGTDRLLLIQRELVVEARVWIDYLNAVYPVLANWVDSRNTVSLRWLALMGFEFPHTADFVTPDGVVFEEFRRCA